MDTPCLSHIPQAAYDNVYPPSEDSMLLIDALEKELKYLKNKDPTFCLEVGSGSGIVITAFGKSFPQTLCFSTDINFKACVISKTTADHNYVILEPVTMDLASCFINKFDVVIFNPPYVVTESSECGEVGIAASWAGGVKGREVTDRLLNSLPKILNDDGTFYLLLIEDNIPDEVIDVMSSKGFKSEIVIKRRVQNENQLVLKFYR